MTRYVLRRIAELLVVFVGVTAVIYVMVYTLPGDPARALGGQRPLSESVVRAIREQYHLDEPVWQQYLRYLGGLFRGDLGVDFTGRSVAGLMADRWPTTLALAGTAWLIEVVLGVGLGVYAALRHGRLTDRAVLALTIVATSTPVFVVGAAAQLLFGVRWGLLPVAGAADGWPVSYLLPACVIAVFGLAAVSRLVRSSMLDNLRADYARTARAKGLRERRVVVVHVLRNSLVPAVTFLAVDLGYLLGGTVIVEGIFNLPGVGQLLFSAIRSHEGPTVVGISTALILVFLLANLVVDLLQGVLDPRVARDG